MGEEEKQEWEKVKKVGKYKFIFGKALFIALVSGLPFALCKFAWKIYKENISLSYLVSSGTIFDYLLTGAFWLFILWLYLCFFRWIYWAKHEDGESK